MGIRFCSLSSGSSGNCQYIESKNTRILIDAGFSGKKIEGLLSSIGVCPTSIDGILVTHEHTDHTRGVGVLSRRYKLPIYANGNTWSAMEGQIGSIKEENTKVFSSEEFFEIKDLTIYPIRIFHDAREPVGYIIYYKGKKISVITDTGIVNDSIKAKIKGSNLYLMESNHDLDMLKHGSYPWPLKQRILSNRGHLSNCDAGRILGETIVGEGETVLLGHLSKDNNNPELAFNTVRDILVGQGIDYGRDITLDLTYRDKTSRIYDL